MLDAIILLLSAYMPMFEYALWLYLAEEFIAWVPFFIYYLIRRD